MVRVLRTLQTPETFAIIVKFGTGPVLCTLQGCNYVNRHYELETCRIRLRHESSVELSQTRGNDIFRQFRTGIMSVVEGINDS